MTNDRVYFVVAIAENKIDGAATHITCKIPRDIAMQVQQSDKYIQDMRFSAERLRCNKDYASAEKVEDRIHQLHKKSNNLLLKAICREEPPNHFTTPWMYKLEDIIEIGQEKVTPSKLKVKV